LIVLCFGFFLALGVSGLKISDPQPAAHAASLPEASVNLNPPGLSEAGANLSAPVLPAPANTALAPLFTPEVQYWAENIVRWSTEHGLDPNIAATVMQIESCGNPDARSSAGASGLFQVMPFHFLAYENAFDPDVNALRGLDYLARSLERSGGDARLALAGYNGGIGVIGRSEYTWAAETIRYAYWGGGIYADAQQNAASSETLNEWLAAGGASLCRSARVKLGLAQ
jgi:soluble lytic murein transglycosylase-like protein